MIDIVLTLLGAMLTLGGWFMGCVAGIGIAEEPGASATTRDSWVSFGLVVVGIVLLGVA